MSRRGIGQYTRKNGGIQRMKYRFEVETIVAARGKLSREERHDVTQYFENTGIEADDAMKAYRMLSKQSAGRLSKESAEEKAIITLPDYGSCQVIVRAYADN